jgi:peptide-methionine (R)-S-oxide reductase
MTRRTFLKGGLALALGISTKTVGIMAVLAKEPGRMFQVTKTDEEWRQILTPEQYRVLRQEGTERPFANKYNANKEPGAYHCAGCDLPVFSSEAKYDSETGWPSFWKPIADSAIGTKTDRTLFHSRTEVHCARCGGHLGHVFDDGPPPTGLRYCINSAALNFAPAKAR